jgi:hypothetical protein
MTGLLNGELAASIYAGFKGKLLTGRFYQHAVAESGGLDSRGDPLVSEPGEPTGIACEGFIDNYSAFSHAQAGIPDTDLKVCVFGKSMPAVTPAERNLFECTGPAGSIYKDRWFQVRRAAIDPAGALWECQSFEIEVPEWA